MVQTFPPEPSYCTEMGGYFNAAFIFNPFAPRTVVIVAILFVSGNVTINETGVIPWSVDHEHRNLYLDIKDKNFTDFAEELHFKPAEWRVIPYDRTRDSFTLTVNGTHMNATPAGCNATLEGLLD
ncbi:hypothetical protein Pmar_PMAR002069 [Perkinsus marinus ATCC 50983]|uniref:Uncharacterized protein n=1 Tax=Perkinsus marinus (strain ATCC 50983 / TXsc) TaxID=423536 RepID=C5LYL2_PERM5|nr:hypothetical protein Pmar_PMAR002069 [Perkinsus marinus ATCC 50983]EEQ98250.1 hypothetical protein Pmar_PMAR002069 [Perkinsus marinus ATCC 50983]|eukprot:XP_002765533.1 hypothetical protein Pmar_PMAR002069 [Perkinsus marinus ATCC 50983]